MNAVAEARQHAEAELNRRDVGDIFVWALLAVYAFARILQVYPGRVPMLGVVALHVLPPAIFAVIHGTRAYRLGGILTFVAITLIVGNFFENLGVRTGFPFGSYYFTDLMGPKLSAVPIMLGLAYVGMAYLSWTLAGIISAGIQSPLSGLRVVAVPVLASCIMVSWDLSQDPVWSNYFACMGLAARRSLLRRAVHQLLRLVPHRICHLPIVRGFLAPTPFDACLVRQPLASGDYLLRSVGGWEFSASSAAAPI